MSEPKSMCVYFVAESEYEGYCREGFPADLSCRTGCNNSCRLYGVDYEPCIPDFKQMQGVRTMRTKDEIEFEFRATYAFVLVMYGYNNCFTPEVQRKERELNWY